MSKEEKNKLLEYHKEHMHTYRAINKPVIKNHFKTVMRGGEVQVILKEEAEINEWF